MMTKSKNVLSNQLMDTINNSMSTKIDEESHNVAGINKISKHVTSPIYNFWCSAG